MHWPDGAVCGACFTAAVRTYGTCAFCGEHRLLPGRSAAGAPLCRDCAGITTTLTCDRCGREAERLRAGTAPAVCSPLTSNTSSVRPHRRTCGSNDSSPSSATATSGP